MGLLVEDLLMLARLDEQRPLENKPVDLLAVAGGFGTGGTSDRTRIELSNFR